MDNWEEGTPCLETDTEVDFGRSLTSGRGYAPFSPDNDGQEDYNGRGEGGGYRGRGDRGGRGGRGGGRGGRGGRGSRGGRMDSDFGERNNDDYESRKNYDYNGEASAFRGRGRGGRGDGRGGGGRGGQNGDGAPEKPRESYIPPEPTNDEGEMFGSAISSGINFNNYDSIPVQVTGDNQPKAISSFEESNLRRHLLENIIKSGYTRPTPIQKNSIPIIMANRDLMACAQTGSGKTAAFLLPIIHNLLSEPEDMILTPEGCAQPQVIIISPTRELTSQIHSEARKFAHGSIIKTKVVYGGTVVHRHGQSNGCHLLVATPGRLLDMVERNLINFASVRFVVLDEADRMLDMGFMKDIDKMMGHPSMVPTEQRTTLMFSATFPQDIQELALKFLKSDYLFISVGIIGGACRDVDQAFYQVTKYQKREKLKELLNNECTERTLVFVETKRNADFIAVFLSEQQFPTTSIHGDRLQREREEALADFKAGRKKLLVATAVAARGLDIKNVAHVINYDLPKTIEEYVHRIGRTGRVGNRGRATSLFDPDTDSALAGVLVKTLKAADQPVPDFLSSASSSGGGSYSAQNQFGGQDIRNYDNSTPAVEEPEEMW